MNVLIVEDEKITADALEEMLRGVAPDCRVVAKLGSVSQTVQWLLTHSVDLIFLDIQLSDGVCFSVFEQVRVQTPVIFTTAYDQYALKAFQLNSVSYLLKPYGEKDLRNALSKFQAMRQSFIPDFQLLISFLQEPRDIYKKRFLVQAGLKFLSVATDQIAYVYSLEKSTFLCMFSGKSYSVDYTLDNLEQQLPPDVFFRINRKFILNIHSIVKMTSYSRSRLKIELQPALPQTLEAIVSIDRSQAFRHWLNR
jgi:two-component system, LytTR family, response regulator LytT